MVKMGGGSARTHIRIETERTDYAIRRSFSPSPYPILTPGCQAVSEVGVVWVRAYITASSKSIRSSGAGVVAPVGRGGGEASRNGLGGGEVGRRGG